MNISPTENHLNRESYKVDVSVSNSLQWEKIEVDGSEGGKKEGMCKHARPAVSIACAVVKLFLTSNSAHFMVMRRIFMDYSLL